MTGFIGAANVTGMIFRDDQRNLPRASKEYRTEHHENPDMGYRTPWWPRSGFEGDPTVDGFIAEAEWWEWPELVSGAVARFGYRGVTRDSNNSPLGGVTVKIFRTADDSKVADDVVSDAGGNYIISTPYYEPHYLVMRKAGAPEVSGVTVSSQYPNT